VESFALDIPGISSWCQRKGVKFLVNEKLGQIALPRPVDPNQAIRFIPRPDRKLITMALPLNFRVPDERMEAYATACSLANSSTFMGAWVLNHAKGEPYFRLTLPTGGLSVTDETVEFLVRLVFGTVDGMAPRLRQVALEGAAPETVLPPTGS
jgi:hypothetical protein